ncbi:MAG TPA: SAM-dependent methyltransferase [Polyangia bacterium]
MKGGDPFIFGRGGEEVQALAEAGIPWEVIPGVTAGVAAAAAVGIPLTHRAYGSSVTFLSGHRADAAPRGGSGAGLAQGPLVFFMCRTALGAIARDLVAAGRAPATPVAIIQRGTCPDQVVYQTTVAALAAADAADPWLDPEAPTRAVVGEVVAFAAALRRAPPRPAAAPLVDRGQAA